MEKVEFEGSGLENVLSMLSEAKAQPNEVNVYNRYTSKIEGISLTKKQERMLSRKGYTPVGDRQYNNWKDSIKFYAYTAKVGGQRIILLDYAHGYSGRLDCRA